MQARMQAHRHAGRRFCPARGVLGTHLIAELIQAPCSTGARPGLMKRPSVYIEAQVDRLVTAGSCIF